MDRLKNIDARLLRGIKRYGPRTHRFSLGLLFVWFGLLIPTPQCNALQGD